MAAEQQLSPMILGRVECAAQAEEVVIDEWMKYRHRRVGRGDTKVERLLSQMVLNEQSGEIRLGEPKSVVLRLCEG
jgi:hypothetical protein